MSAHRNGPPLKRVCVDENLPRPITLHLGRIWPRTRFDHVAGFPIVTSAWHGAPAAYNLRPAPYTAAHLRVRALADIVSGIAAE